RISQIAQAELALLVAGADQPPQWLLMRRFVAQSGTVASLAGDAVFDGCPRAVADDAFFDRGMAGKTGLERGDVPVECGRRRDVLGTLGKSDVMDGQRAGQGRIGRHDLEPQPDLE